MTAAAEHAPDESPRWHGRRRGRRLRKGRQALVETLLPRLSVPCPADGLIDLAALFPPTVEDIWLEVGFGAGEHLAEQARRHPRVGMIGCEPFVNGVASLLAQVERDRLSNIRVFADDVRLLLPHVPEAAIGRVFVLFADPWPKKRHHGRRFIAPENLQALARLMKDGAELRFASDHMGYVAWVLEHMTRHGDFRWTARTPADWRQRPADWIETRYESKALAEGTHCVYLRFERRPRRRL